MIASAFTEKQTAILTNSLSQSVQTSVVLKHMRSLTLLQFTQIEDLYVILMKYL